MDNDDQHFQEWVAARPPLVRDAIKRFDPRVCYHAIDNAGHYTIYSFEEHGEEPVTVSLIHGQDSYLPGIRVFGVSLETIKRCGCGMWEYPDQKQVERTRAMIEHAAAKRGSA